MKETRKSFDALEVVEMGHPAVLMVQKEFAGEVRWMLEWSSVMVAETAAVFGISW